MESKSGDSINCPYCGKANPKEAIKCSCGYSFDKAEYTEYTKKLEEENQEIKPSSTDSLAGWAIFSAVFTILSLTIVGGGIGGLIAGVISVPIAKALPIRFDGKKLPVALSIVLLVAAIIVFLVGHLVLMKR